MRNGKILKKISILLAASLTLLTAAGCAAKPVTDNEVILAELNGKEWVQQEYSAVPNSVSKEETVYVTLSPVGNVRAVSVTDRIHTDVPQVRVADISDLTEIRNVKTLTKPVYEDGKLYWDMDTTDLYYSGVSAKQPPVSFSITYSLDGKEMRPEDMAGKSGEVKIVIKAENTLKATFKVKGEVCEMSCPMLMAGGMILSEENFTGITVKNGTTISDGAKQVVFFAGVPGIDESLGLSKLNVNLPEDSFYSSTYTITAHTESFEMGNMMFAVVPLTSVSAFADAMGGGTFPDTIESAKSLLADIEKIQAAMQGLDLQHIIDLLYGDSNKIEEMMNAVSEASVLYNENEKLIKTFSKYMTDENIAKLDKLANDLNNTDLEAVSSTLSDPALRQLLALLPRLSESLGSVSVLAQDLNDVMPLFEALSKDMEDPEIQKSLKELPETIKKLKRILGVLEENRELLEALGNVATSGGTEQLEELVQSAGKYAGIGALSDKQSEMLTEKMKTWVDFGKMYSVFSDYLPNMETSVMFTYKTDAVYAPKEEKESSFFQKSEDGGNKLVNWFKNLFK